MDDDTHEWILEQFRAAGWDEEEIERGEKYRRGRWYAVAGGLLCILLVTAPIGLPLVVVGAYRIKRYSDPGERYRTAFRELKAEFDRRDDRGDALWSPVDDEWWSNRLPN